MTLKVIKVEIKTLEQISDIIGKDPQGQCQIQQVVSDSIEKLWQDTCNPKSALVLIDETLKDIEARPEYRDTVKKLTGSDGPYTITKTCKSWIGLSEGVYQIKDCPILVPVAWFTTPSKKIEENKLNRLIVFFLTMISLFQAIILLILLL